MTTCNADGFYFSSSAKEFLATSNDLVFEMSLTQFRQIESQISGSQIGCGSFQDAITWLHDRDQALHQEALANKANGWGYGLPMGYCKFAVSLDYVAYCTTRGTVFKRYYKNKCEVYLPVRRRLGHHHSVILHNLLGIDLNNDYHCSLLNTLGLDLAVSYEPVFHDQFELEVMLYEYENGIMPQDRPQDRYTPEDYGYDDEEG